MGKIKNNPERYFKRSDIGFDREAVRRNRLSITKSHNSLLLAQIDACGYIKFRSFQKE